MNDGIKKKKKEEKLELKAAFWIVRLGGNLTVMKMLSQTVQKHK